MKCTTERPTHFSVYMKPHRALNSAALKRQQQEAKHGCVITTNYIKLASLLSIIAITLMYPLGLENRRSEQEIQFPGGLSAFEIAYRQFSASASNRTNNSKYADVLIPVPVYRSH